MFCGNYCVVILHVGPINATVTTEVSDDAPEVSNIVNNSYMCSGILQKNSCIHTISHTPT